MVEQREQLQDSLNSAHQKLTDVDHKIENLTKLQVKFDRNINTYMAGVKSG